MRPAPLRPLALTVALTLAGCASVGPDYQPPRADAPASWAARPGSAPELAGSLAVSTDALPASWWTVFGDATLDALQARARAASPDLQTATLRFAQSRLQRQVIASQGGPQVDANAQITRQRQSEYSAETRLAGALGGANRGAMIELLSDPFTLYQAGFDVSWELDLWGRVKRSVESADANVEMAGARLEDARLTLASELARAYFELRLAQRQSATLARQIAVATDLLGLLEAQAANGLSDQGPVVDQRARLAELTAQQAPLRAQEAAASNQIGVLTGDAPGALNDVLAAPGPAVGDVLPALTLGVPSELARRRPDVRAAEADLHAATAEIGVATADLYPRIALGASAGLQSLRAGDFADWGARTWQVGPMLSLPIFDQGRRRATVALRKLEQQTAAVAWHQTVLKAWQEVDDALNTYAAEQRRHAQVRAREASLADQMQLAQARRANGLSDELQVLQAALAWRQAQMDVQQSDARLRTGLVGVYKAVGGGVVGR